MALTSVSSAQVVGSVAGGIDPMDPSRSVNPISVVQGDGVKVGDGTALYPQVGLETGYVSNVFYTNDAPVGAGLLRVIIEAGAGSLSQARTKETTEENGTTVTDQGDFQYAANLYATWDQYLSGNDSVQAQGGLGLGALLRGIVNPGKPLSFHALDNFSRVIRATNFESRSDTNRDINTLMLQLVYAPNGRSINGAIRYTNTLDLFEQDTERFADRFQNSIGLRVNYKFLPLTQAYVDVSQGVYTGIGAESTKVTSFPLTAVVGINTAITFDTSVIGRVGYTQGFYSSGPSYQTVTGGIYVEHRYPLGKFDLLYSYDHEDSINANFYRDHVLSGWIEHHLIPFTVYASPSLRFREYEGLISTPMTPITGSSATRDDVIFDVAAGMRYQFRNWIQATLEYRLTIDETGFRYDAGGSSMQDPSYIRHELLLGARAAY